MLRKIGGDKKVNFSEEKFSCFPRAIGSQKKAQSLTLGTIILIVLGVAVLVFLIWGFSQGWSNLWGKITAYTGGGSNVDDVKAGCALACTGMQENAFCFEEQTVKAGGQTFQATCNQLARGIPLIAKDTNCISYYGAKWRTTCSSSEEKVEDIGDSRTPLVCCVNIEKKAATDAEMVKIRTQVDTCPNLC